MKQNNPKQTLVLDALIGLAVGDALGAPNEFLLRSEVSRNPVKDMEKQALFTDDTSMNLCLLDSLIRNKKVIYGDIMDNFVLWVGAGAFTPRGQAFGMGNTTMRVLNRYIKSRDPLHSGSTDEFENGNGALMRIIPLSFYLFDRWPGDFLSSKEAYQIARNVIAMTHAHARNIAGCLLYLAVVEEILIARHQKGMPLTYLQMRKAIHLGLKKAFSFLEKEPDLHSQIPYYSKLLFNPRTKSIHLETFVEAEISSSGYVVDTLEAALWCCLTTRKYSDSVLKAANLGDDADTVACVTGSMTGLAYGKNQIPKRWMKRKVALDQVEKLAEAYQAQLDN